MMKRLFLVAFICLTQMAMADDVENLEFLYNYLAGTYHAIGQEMDSKKTYSGTVVFKRNGNQLDVTRIINGERITGIGKIEYALGPDKAKVLRVRFTRKDLKYEITYLWRSDLGNYALLSGYIYQPGKHTSTPGLEALFVEHTDP